MSQSVDIQVSPSLKPLFDDPVQIKITGLSSGEPVTIAAGVEEKGKKFVSYGLYMGDSEGCVDLTKASSLGGTFTGVHPMGLFWSLQQAKGQRPGLALLFNLATQPMIFNLSVIKGHILVDHFDLLVGADVIARTVLERYFLSDNVERIPIRKGGVIGTIFAPRDGERHPGLIDMTGGGYGLLEFRAALLANKGFVTFALAWELLEGLPGPRGVHKLEYMENALALLESHPSVFPGKLGVIGLSRGGEMGAFLAAINQKIKACVLINSLHFNMHNVTYKGRTFEKVGFDFFNAAVGTSEGISFKKAYWDGANSRRAPLPVTESDNVEYLLIYGGDDAMCDPFSGKRIKEMCNDAGRDNCELIIYPGAGHILSPPYYPRFDSMYTKFTGGVVLFGGEMGKHAAAQEDMWPRIIGFLRQQLKTDHGKL